MPSADGSQTLRAVADSGEGSPLVAVTNLSDMGQHVTIRCVARKDESASKSVDLLAGETLLTEACAARTVHSATMEDFSASERGESHGPVGISVTTDGMPGSIAAFGLQPHKTGDSRSFSNITFVDPMMLMSPSTVFDGVPVGRATLLQTGNYVPGLSLTNFSAKELQVSIQYSRSGQGTPETKELARFNIPAGASKKVAFDDLQGDSELQNSFVVSSNGSPGDVLAKLVSNNESAHDRVELLGKDAQDMNNGGSNPWSTEDGTESTLLLFNHDQAPQIFNVLVTSQDGSQWDKDFKLAPMETYAIGISEIVKQQLKDDKGKTLSQTSVSGQISWWTVGTASGPGAGRLLQTNHSSGSARSFACGCPYILCGVDIIENLQAILFGNTGTPLDTANGTICMYKSGSHCSGTTSSNSSSQALHYSWSSGNGAILQISGSSTNSSVNVTGASVGTASMTGTISATYFSPPETCSFSGGGSTPVKPKMLLGSCSGTDITNSTQAVVAGQQIIVCGSYTLPSGSTFTSQSWTIPGTGSTPPTAISNYTYTVGSNTTTGGPVFLTPTQLDEPSVTYYFIAPSNGQAVVFTLDYSAGGTGQTATAQATFNIAGPTPTSTNAPFATTSLGNVVINSGNPYPFLQFGGTSNNIGIGFTAAANQPAGYSPVFKWVNIISDDNVTMIDSNGSQQTSLGTGLDVNPSGGYPSFSNLTANTTNDNPGLQLIPPCTEIKRTFDARTYLMWNAGLTNPPSIDIPLGSLTWGFSGDAVLNSGTWGLNGTPSKYAVGFVNSPSYPSWSTGHRNSSGPACP